MSLDLDGILFFPVTPFDTDGRVDLDLLEEHVSSRLPFAPGGVFPACGTGEFHALTSAEVEAVVARTVETVRRSASSARGDAVSAGKRVPVVAGVGGPVAVAAEQARAAESSGADALLVLPPYLVGAPRAGLEAYVRAILAATALPIVLYRRGSALYDPALMTRLAAEPQIVGLKDGVGSLDVMQSIVLAVRAAGRNDFLFFNGLLTAELTQGAYRGIGVPLYSSAAFAMAPGVALAHFEAYNRGDEAGRLEILDRFYRPLVALRDEVPGFGVSLIKAGLRLGGLDVGSVRAPLVDPDPRQLDELARILAIGEEIAGSRAAGRPAEVRSAAAESGAGRVVPTSSAAPL